VTFADAVIELKRLATDSDGKCNLSDEGQAELERCWTIFDTYNHQQLDRFLSTSDREALIRLTKRNVYEVTSMSLLPKDRPAKTAEALACICAAVTFHLSVQQKQSHDKKAAKDGLMRPHPVQVLGLFRLLGIDQPTSLYSSFMSFMTGPKAQNHLIQILTGQGKSIVLAVLSIFLALSKFQVDTVCYSKYLTQRDYDAFKQLFVVFGIDADIRYKTFSELSRDIFNEKGDLRTGTLTFL